jgi:hypothetical protein
MAGSVPARTNAGDCVEVAVNLPGVVAVRDSKDPQGPALAFTRAGWPAFATLVRSADPGPASAG